MRFLADENIPVASIRRLRAAGYDIVSIIEDSPGAKDEAILLQAHAERRIILTFDRDYGSLIYRRRLPGPAGVAYFRFVPTTPEELAERFIDKTYAVPFVSPRRHRGHRVSQKILGLLVLLRALCVSVVFHLPQVRNSCH